jgi:hypothetical protein
MLLGLPLLVAARPLMAAEWADRRQRERDIIDRTQTQLCVTNPATGLCG